MHAAIILIFCRIPIIVFYIFTQFFQASDVTCLFGIQDYGT